MAEHGFDFYYSTGVESGGYGARHNPPEILEKVFKEIASLRSQ
jgi:hypothetical protein